jgi:hypothetical protein
LTARRLIILQHAELFDEEVKAQGAEIKNRTKLVAALLFALGSNVAVAQQQQTLTGTLTDSTCGTSHMAKDKTPAECTRMCVKDGMNYALAVDKKICTLEDHDAQLSKLAGQRVTVKGTLKGDTVTIELVLPGH